MTNKHQRVEALKGLLQRDNRILFSLLFGSQARGDASEQSDWDIAIWLTDNSNPFDNLGVIEDIRSAVAHCLELDQDHVDLVDLRRSALSINASIVEEGVVMSGDGTLELPRFYQRIWALLENNYMYRLYGAQ